MNRLTKPQTLTLTLLTTIILATTLNITLAQTNEEQTNIATVTVMNTVGGTTDPTPGNYTFPEGTTLTLTATPDTGFKFQYWVIYTSYAPGYGVPGHEPSSDSDIITTNPLTITCGYGYIYTYQPLFTPTNANVPTENTTPTYLYAAIAVLAVVAATSIALVFLKRRKQ